jgi:type IV secretory pathway VirB6-like protein
MLGNDAKWSVVKSLFHQVWCDYSISCLVLWLFQLHVFCNVCVCFVQGGSNMTGTNCDLFTHKSSGSYLNHLVICSVLIFSVFCFCTYLYCFVVILLVYAISMFCICFVLIAVL